MEAPRQLSSSELAFLKELLWLTSNIAADCDDSAYYLLENGLAKTLYLLVKEYNTQLSWELWKLVIWNFRNLANVLKFFEAGLVINAVLDPFEMLIKGHGA